MKRPRLYLLLPAAILIGSLAFPTSGRRRELAVLARAARRRTSARRTCRATGTSPTPSGRPRCPASGMPRRSSGATASSRSPPCRRSSTACCSASIVPRARSSGSRPSCSGPLEKINRENSYASGTPATDGKRVYVNFRVGDEIVVAAHDAGRRETALAGPAGHARRRVGIQQRARAVQRQGHRRRRQQGRFLPDRLEPRRRTNAVARRPHPSRDQLQRPADPRNGRPHPVDPVRRPLRDQLRSRHGQAALDGRRPVGGVRRHAVLQREGRAGLRQQQLARSAICWPSSRTAAAMSPRPTSPGATTRVRPTFRRFMVAGDFLFSVNNAGVAFCYEAATGKVLWQERLGRHHASPVLVERAGLSSSTTRARST